ELGGDLAGERADVQDVVVQVGLAFGEDAHQEVSGLRGGGDRAGVLDRVHALVGDAQGGRSVGRLARHAGDAVGAVDGEPGAVLAQRRGDALDVRAVGEQRAELVAAHAVGAAAGGCGGAVQGGAQPV